MKTIKPRAAITFPLSYRKVEISDNDRDWKSLDAWHLFPEWETRTFSRHHRSKRLHQNISHGTSPLQYKVKRIANVSSSSRPLQINFHSLLYRSSHLNVWWRKFCGESTISNIKVLLLTPLFMIQIFGLSITYSLFGWWIYGSSTTFCGVLCPYSMNEKQVH